MSHRTSAAQKCCGGPSVETGDEPNRCPAREAWLLQHHSKLFCRPALAAHPAHTHSTNRVSAAGCRVRRAPHAPVATGACTCPCTCPQGWSGTGQSMRASSTVTLVPATTVSPVCGDTISIRQSNASSSARAPAHTAAMSTATFNARHAPALRVPSRARLP